MNRTVLHIVICCLCSLVISSSVSGAEQAGSVIALHGKAFIERDQKKSAARLRDAVMMSDTVLTGEASRVKLLFSDDSVLTLGEKSGVVIREYLSSRGKGRSAIFNLIDGKLKAVVGKSAFEVHTPTAVAAARGTVILFETGIRNGRKFATMVCVEGTFLARSADPRFTEEVPVSAGMTITSVEGQPLTRPVPASDEERERLLRETDMSGYEITIPGPSGLFPGLFGQMMRPLGGFRPDVGLAPVQQPPQATTPVQINVVFP